MGKIRLFCSESLEENKFLSIYEENFHYLVNVMRCDVGSEVLLFNEANGEFKTQVKEINKKNLVLEIIRKIKYQNNNVDEKFMDSIISFIFLYILIFFVVTALLSLDGLNFITAISAAATSISNVGPGLGDIIGPNGSFSSLSDFSKWVLSAAMILGRLELFAILVLFIPSFWRKY